MKTLKEYRNFMNMTEKSKEFIDLSFRYDMDSIYVQFLGKVENGYQLVLLENNRILGIQITKQGYAPCFWGDLQHYIRIKAANLHRHKEGFYTENCWIISNYIKRVTKVLKSRYNLSV